MKKDLQSSTRSAVGWVIGLLSEKKKSSSQTSVKNSEQTNGRKPIGQKVDCVHEEHYHHQQETRETTSKETLLHTKNKKKKKEAVTQVNNYFLNEKTENKKKVIERKVII